MIRRLLISTSACTGLVLLTLCHAMASEPPRLQINRNLASVQSADLPSGLRLDPIPHWQYSPVWEPPSASAVAKAPRVSDPRSGRRGHLSPQGSSDRPPRGHEMSAVARDPAAPTGSPRPARDHARPELPVLVTAGSTNAAPGTQPADGSGARKANFYASFRLLPSLSNVDDISRSPPAPIQLEDSVIEFVAAAAVAVGYDWRNKFDLPLKTELEYRYRYHLDIEARSQPANVFYDASTRHAHSIQANFWLPWRVFEDLDALVGGGFGFTRHRTETDRVNTQTGSREQKSATTNDFSWQLGAGLDYRFAEDWSAEVMYRYADLGKIETGTFSTGDSVTYGHTYSHEFAFGIDYHF